MKGSMPADPPPALLVEKTEAAQPAMNAQKATSMFGK